MAVANDHRRHGHFITASPVAAKVQVLTGSVEHGARHALGYELVLQFP